MRFGCLIKKFTIVVSTATLAACATVDVQAQSKPPRVYAGSCIFGVDREDPVDGESAILASVAGAIIKVGLNRIGKALRAAGEEQTTTVSALRNTEFKPGRAVSCIQFVAGGTGKNGQCGLSATGADSQQVQTRLAAKCEALKNAGIYLDSAPSLFLELQLRPSTAGTAYAVSPTFLSYQKKLRDGKSKRDETRGLAVQARFHGPGVAANGKGSVGGTVVLGNVAVGSETAYEFPTAELSDETQWELESQWFPALNPPIENMPDPGSPDASDPKHPGNALLPITVTVSISETRDARPFYLFLADVFDESKEELQASAEKLLIESKREEAELAAFTASQTAQANADAKHVAAEVAIVAYCSANYAAGTTAQRETLALTNSGAARAAQIAANMAARTAARTAVYPTLIAISKDAPTAGVTDGC